MTLLRFKNIKLQSYKPGKSLLAGNKNIIKLSANESALGVSKNVEKIVKSKFDISKYPDSKFSELTQKISKKYNCDKSKIICGSGSDEVIQMLCQLFLRENDEVVVPQYSFLMYRIYSKIVGANVKLAKEINFKVSVKEILKKTSKKNLISLKKKKLSKNLDWVMSHPISGSEVSGPKYGNANLFKNKWCIIIKDRNVLKQKKVERFWKSLGSKIIIMNPDDHDKIFSVTSHLPHLIAYNLIKTAQDFQKKKNKNLIKFSAGGLRDFSRIAASNEIMWRDIFFENKTNMIEAINLFMKNLKDFKNNISKKENSKIIKKLINSKVVRKQIISQKQDISKPDFGRE